jgi:hypothetical protein
MCVLIYGRTSSRFGCPGAEDRPLPPSGWIPGVFLPSLRDLLLSYKVESIFVILIKRQGAD